MRENIPNMVNRNQKDNLARLLASEDLVIEHKKCPTAYFELKARKLVCPILKDDMSSNLYDLFMGHEVGHALNTPEEGWHSAASKKGAKYRGYLNVLEDVRIEKAIKEKYAGLRRCFYDAYKELHHDLDFFGVKKMNVNKLAFIDRINLYFKVGHSLMVDFSPTELKIINTIATKMDTWEKVVIMADHLFELSKLEDVEPQEQPNPMQVPQFDDEDGTPESDDESESMPMGGDDEENEEGEDGESSSGNEPSDEDAEGESDSSESSDEKDEDDNTTDGEGTEKSDEDEQVESSKEGGQDGGEANESITDKNSRENEKDFLHEDNDTTYGTDNEYYELNTSNWKFQDHKVGYKQIFADFDNYWNTNTYTNEQYDSETDSYVSVGLNDTTDAERYVNEFMSHNQKIVNYMAKEFDMRKAAAMYKRSRSAKSGEIDMSKIQNYLIKDDIFKRVNIVPDGKNHGMIMLLDWSGSMSDCIKETVEQCVILAMFCRRVGIPHRVYAFSDAYNKRNGKRFLGQKIWNEDDQKLEGEERTAQSDFRHEEARAEVKAVIERGDAYVGKTRLLEFFSDKMNNNDFKKMLVNVFCAVESMNYSRRKGEFANPMSYAPDNYRLGGTPLDESLLIMRDYIVDFKINYNLDKLQFVTLTDGSSFDANGLNYKHGNSKFHDRKARKTYEYNSRYGRRYGALKGSGTDTLLNWIEDTTGVDTVGFFICGQGYRDFDSACNQFSKMDLDYSEEYERNQEGHKIFKKEGGYKLECGPLSGYKEFYLLNKKKMQIDTDADNLNVEEGASKQKLKGAMLRMGKNKLAQRKILQHFIKKVA